MTSFDMHCTNGPDSLKRPTRKGNFDVRDLLKMPMRGLILVFHPVLEDFLGRVTAEPSGVLGSRPHS